MPGVFIFSSSMTAPLTADWGAVRPMVVATYRPYELRGRHQGYERMQRRIGRANWRVGSDQDPVEPGRKGCGRSYQPSRQPDVFALRWRALPSQAPRGEGLVLRKEYLSGEFLEEARSEEHTSELQSLMRISYAVFCLKK